MARKVLYGHGKADAPRRQEVLMPERDRQTSLGGLAKPSRTNGRKDGHCIETQLRDFERGKRV